VLSLPRKPPEANLDRGAGSRAVLLGSLLVVLAVTFAAYTGVFSHEFLGWDDPEYVVKNSLVLERDYGALVRTIISSNYHPLTMLSLAANAAPPLSPRPFLVTNVLLHTLNTGLVFWLVLLLSGRRLFAAFWSALFFGIHPMHVESVAWISERKDLLYTAFFLGAAIAYWRYLDARRWPWLGITFLMFALSCFSKGMAVVFPLVMVLLDIWRRRPFLERTALLEKTPFFATSLLFGLVAIDVQGGGDFHGLLLRTSPHLKGLADSLPFSPWERPVLPTYGFAMYAWKLFVPTGLSAFYPYPSPAEAARPVYLIPAALMFAAIALVVWDFRRTRVLTFGLGWYLVTIAPVLQWIPVGAAIMADRYTYLSYVGPLFVLAMGVSRLAESGRTLKIALSIVLGILAALAFTQTTRQAEIWRNSESLWTNVIRLYPRCDLAYLARGNARGPSGRIQEALSDLRTAQSLGSKQGSLYDGLGNAYVALGHPDSALAMYGAGLALQPNMGRLYFNRAVAYLRLARPKDALADLDQARRLAPTEVLDLHAARGDAYLQLKAFREAAAEYDRALQSGAPNPSALYNRAVCRWNLGDSSGAAVDFREARRIAGSRP
jgi:protein O-mannosyl-transferase